MTEEPAKKLKFSGISFGGYFGGGTTIFSPHYRLRIGKDKKTKEYTFTVKDRKHFSLFVIFMLIALPIDTFYYLLQFHEELVAGFFNFVFGFISSTPGGGVPVHQSLIGLLIIEILLLLFLFFILYIEYFFSFKGVKPWHGCEHKLIASAENNDIDNMRNYSRINDRCGGCYLFTIYTFVAVYWIALYHFFNIVIPVGMLTLSFFVMFLEAKLFHKYNWIGIRVGRVLQKHITTAEPLDYQVEIGIKGMKELVKKEEEFQSKQ
jgi:uncharacterized protein YqhQ